MSPENKKILNKIGKYIKDTDSILMYNYNNNQFELYCILDNSTLASSSTLDDLINRIIKND
jgi:hypothetical protein